MPLKIGKSYTFRYSTGREETGEVVDIVGHPDLEPIYKVRFDTGLRLVRSSRLREIPIPPIEAELDVLVPSPEPQPPAEPPSRPVRFQKLRDWVARLRRREV